jgi:hypothetical protein
VEIVCTGFHGNDTLWEENYTLLERADAVWEGADTLLEGISAVIDRRYRV